MPILHDNRNMRPDLTGVPVEDVDDIFASADAQMEQLRQKQMFTPNRKKIQWKKRFKRTITITIILSLLVLLIGGFIAARYSYNLMVLEIQTQVLDEVTQMKTALAEKEESELTEEDLLMLGLFEIISDEDILRMVESATSIEEIIHLLKTQNLDINRYLTPAQQKELDALFIEYAEGLQPRIEEWEAELNTEPTQETTTETQSSESNTETTPVTTPTITE